MTLERFINKASEGCTTYGTRRLAFHGFRASRRDMNGTALQKNAGQKNSLLSRIFYPQSA